MTHVKRNRTVEEKDHSMETCVMCQFHQNFNTAQSPTVDQTVSSQDVISGHQNVSRGHALQLLIRGHQQCEIRIEKSLFVARKQLFVPEDKKQKRQQKKATTKTQMCNSACIQCYDQLHTPHPIYIHKHTHTHTHELQLTQQQTV